VTGRSAPLRAAGLAPFKLEAYFERYEFSVPYLLSSSDVEPWRMDELLALADDELRGLWAELSLGYTEVRGHPLLRETIASLYASCEAEDVIVFAAAQEPIFAFANVAVAPGEHVIAVVPTYQSLYEVARSRGAEVSLVPLRPDWTLDVDAIRRELRPGTSLIVLNAPNQPTGSLPTEAELRELFALGPRVFVDEVYRFLEHDPRDRLPAAADLGGTSLGVMSKSFGLAGLRIGWLATRDAELRERLVAFKHYLTICSAGPSELLAIVALRAREAVLARSRAIVEANLPVLDDFIARRDDFSWVRPRAGTTGLIELGRDVPIDAFARELADEEGVMILPASVFDWPGNGFRVGYARAGMPEALARLERFADR
jgi:aspartate/methionine/tyrosine aminotransferase